MEENVKPTNEEVKTEVDTVTTDKKQKKEKKQKVVEVKAKDINKKKQKKEKKPSKFKKALKDTGNELKKVTWPKFGQVVKQTGIVLVVVFIVSLVLFGFDRLCSLLYELLLK